MPIAARSIPPVEGFWRVVARRPLQAALLACTVLLALALLGLGLMLHEQGRDRELRAIQDQLAQEREKNERFVKEERDRSLRALNLILDDTIDGPLETIAGLGPLHDRLRAYYDGLVQRQEGQSFDEPAR